MKTRSLLDNSGSKDRDWHLGCHLLIRRVQEEITWQRFPSLKKHSFSLELKGQL